MKNPKCSDRKENHDPPSREKERWTAEHESQREFLLPDQGNENQLRPCLSRSYRMNTSEIHLFSDFFFFK